MKKQIYFIALAFCCSSLVLFTAYGQTPQGVNYQAVARDAGGNILANQKICVRSTLTDGNGGPDIYIETFNISTNQFGLFTLNIGNGVPVATPFNTINWGGVTPWQKIEIDIVCLGSYTLMGSSQWLSVPYSLYSLTSEKTSAVNGSANYVSKFTAADSIGNSQIFDNGTNVGIGTSSPQNKLDVNNSGIGSSAKFNSAGDNFLGIYEGNTYKGWVGSYYGSPDDIDLGSSSGSVHLVTGSTIDLTAKNGNIGIGTTTPLQLLDVNKAGTGIVARLNATNQTYLGFYEGGIYRGYVGSYFGDTADIDLGSPNGAVHLTTGGSIDLTADAGDIGIGITTPAAKLDINSTGTGQTVKVNAASDVFMGFWEGGGYRGYVGSYYGGIADMDLGSLAGAVHLVTGSSIDLTAKAGKIGIGTTAPAQMLEVSNPAGSAYIKLTSQTSNDQTGIDFTTPGGGSQWRVYTGVTGSLNFAMDADELFTSPSTYYLFDDLQFYPGFDNITSLGYGANRWTEVWATDGTINTSDAREKSNIRDINYGLSTVMQLRPVSYTWSERPEKGTKLGLIAQEVKDVVSEVVTNANTQVAKDDNGNTLPAVDRYGIYYSDLIPVLIKAIQEQQKTIEEQDARIKALELRKD